jgi:hypothetical protein
MKLNDLILDFEIATTNEEKQLLSKMKGLALLDSYPEREQVIIQNLIRKSLVSKVVREKHTFVVPNELKTNICS